MTTTEQAVLPNTRRTVKPQKRVPLHDQRDKMTVDGRDPDFIYRWVNDIENGERIQKFQKAGYEVVQDKVTVGEPTENDKYGLNKTSTVLEKSVGGNVKAILMRQRKEDYEADQKAKDARVDTQEAQMKQDYLEKFGALRGSALTIKKR